MVSLELAAVSAVALALVAVALAVVRSTALWLLQRSFAQTEGPALPAHYSSLANASQERRPGHCPDCGTQNEVGYQFCQRCSAELPTADATYRGRSYEQIFGS